MTLQLMPEPARAGSLPSIWRRPLHGALGLATCVVLAACGAGEEELGGGQGGGNDPGGGDPGGGDPGGGDPGGGGGDPGAGGGGQGGGTGEPLQISPGIYVQNTHNEDVTAVMRASVPFPEGMIDDLSTVGVSGRATAWMPMQVWPDGSVKIAQAQFTDDLPANSTTEYEVVQGVEPLTGAFVRNDWITRRETLLAARVQVTDTGDHPYEIETPLLDGTVLHETPLVRTWHQRHYHQPMDPGCINRDYLTSQFYVTEFRDAPFLVVDWIIGNDYLGSDTPNGSTDPNLYPLADVDVNDVAVMFKGHMAVEPHLAEWNDIGARYSDDGWRAFPVMQDDWIGDGQTRRYRFTIRVEPGTPQPDVAARWQRSFRGMVRAPVFPMADIRTWQLTHALGIHGGPNDAPSNAAFRAEYDYGVWLGRSELYQGTWGFFGDVNMTGTAGTPRNTPLTRELSHAIQAESRDLLVVLETMAWAQAIRPYHLWNLQVGAEQDILLYYSIPYSPRDPAISRDTLGRKALLDNDPYPHLRTRTDWRAHNSNGYDENHWTTDILFDYWTITGDHWAKEELRNLGESLKGMMRLTIYATARSRNARSEGWCMVGFVQAYLATQDEAIKDYAVRRIHEINERDRWSNHPSRTMKEYPPDPRTGFGMDVTWFPPWEHGSVMLGYLGAWKYFGDEAAMQIAEDVVTLIDYSWVSDYTHPVTGQYYEHLVRYWTPMRQGGQNRPPDFLDDTIGAYIPSQPLGSVNKMLVGGLDLIRRATSNPTVAERASWQLSHLYAGGNTDDRLWDKWFSVLPSWYSNQPPSSGGGGSSGGGTGGAGGN